MQNGRRVASPVFSSAGCCESGLQRRKRRYFFAFRLAFFLAAFFFGALRLTAFFAAFLFAPFRLVAFFLAALRFGAAFRFVAFFFAAFFAFFFVDFFFVAFFFVAFFLAAFFGAALRFVDFFFAFFFGAAAGADGVIIDIMSAIIFSSPVSVAVTVMLIQHHRRCRRICCRGTSFCKVPLDKSLATCCLHCSHVSLFCKISPPIPTLSIAIVAISHRPKSGSATNISHIHGSRDSGLNNSSMRSRRRTTCVLSPSTISSQARGRAL